MLQISDAKVGDEQFQVSPHLAPSVWLKIEHNSVKKGSSDERMSPPKVEPNIKLIEIRKKIRDGEAKARGSWRRDLCMIVAIPRQHIRTNSLSDAK